MPLFNIADEMLTPIVQSELDSEKRLQRLIEKSLGAAFNCRFVSSEFSTGATHAGRIDTLALSEESNPVILEYKKVESSDLINQSLFYLSWLADHRGDFEIAVRDKFGSGIEIDWSDIRVICLAPNYKRYDLHAVQVMGANIELWRYRLFANSTLYLEEVYRKAVHSAPTTDERVKDPVMVAAGKKAAATRATATYTFDERIAGKPPHIIDIAQQVREYITSLDPGIEEAPKKFYVAYKTTQNIVCMEIQKQQVLLYLKLDPSKLSPMPTNARDVTNIGHFGTGDLELTIKSEADLPVARGLIGSAYREVGA